MTETMYIMAKSTDLVYCPSRGHLLPEPQVRLYHRHSMLAQSVPSFSNSTSFLHLSILQLLQKVPALPQARNPSIQKPRAAPRTTELLRQC